jgi:hypothetical protein
MPIAFGNQTGIYSGTAGATSQTIAFTAALGADVFVAISTNTSVSRTLTSIAYGGVGMTLVGRVGHGSAFPGTFGNTYLYRSAGGGSGAAKNVTFTFNASTQQVGNIFSYTGVASVGTATTSFATSTSPSVGPISCSAGDLIVGVIGNGTATNVSYITGTSPTGAARYTVNAAANYGYIAAPYESTTSGVTFGSTSFGNTGWGAIAVVLTPSGAAAPTNQFFTMF